MKKTIQLLLLQILFSVFALAQINNVNHLFPNKTIGCLSATNGKFVWIDTTGNHYSISTLDTNFNITTVVNTALSIPSIPTNTSFVDTGVVVLNTCYDKQGILWGLLFDLDAYHDSIMGPNGFTYLGQDCFFLYDFNNSIRKNFSFQNSLGYLTPLEPDFKSTMIMNKDTMVVTFYNSTSGNLICNSKFLNGNMISTSNATSSSLLGTFYMHTFIDENKFEHIVTSDVQNQYFQKNDFIHYADIVITNSSSHITTSFLVDSLNNFISYNSNFIADTLCIRTNGITTYKAVPGNGGGSLWNAGVEICTDHANRYWVIKNYALQLLQGNTWTSFTTTMRPFTGSFYPDWKRRVFAEFGHNKFVVANYDFHLTDSIGNGIYYFTYQPNTVNLESHKVNSAKLFYQKNESKITLKNAEHLTEFTLVDVNGKIILSAKNQNQNSFDIDVPQLAKGFYFLKCRTIDEKNESIKFAID